MAYYGGLEGILTGLTKSTDHPSIFLCCARICGALGSVVLRTSHLEILRCCM